MPTGDSSMKSQHKLSDSGDLQYLILSIYTNCHDIDIDLVTLMKTFFFWTQKSNICEVVGVWCEISDCPDQILDIIATPAIQTSTAASNSYNYQVIRAFSM